VKAAGIRNDFAAQKNDAKSGVRKRKRPAIGY
jgi:hypothetical protein